MNTDVLIFAKIYRKKGLNFKKINETTFQNMLNIKFVSCRYKNGCNSHTLEMNYSQDCLCWTVTLAMNPMTKDLAL